MLIGFIILLAVVVVGFPSSGLSDAAQRAASPVKRDASLPDLGVNSDISSGWYEFEDSITATKAVEGHAQKRDAQVKTDFNEFAKRQSRSEANTISYDTKRYQPLPLEQSENTEDFTQNAETDLSSNQPLIQTSFKRSPNDYSYSDRGNARKMQPVERDSPSNKKRQFGADVRMDHPDIRMHNRYLALRPLESENTETFEQNPAAATSNALALRQSESENTETFEQNPAAATSDALALRPSESENTETFEQNPAAATYDALALLPSESENTETFEQNPVAATSDAQPLSESSFKPSHSDHAQKRDIALRRERPVESAVETHGKRESRSESELVGHDIGAYRISPALQATDAESTGAYEQSPDAELSETNVNSIGDSETPVKSSLEATPSELDFTNQAVKRHTRQPLLGVKPYSFFLPISQLNNIIRRQNSPLPGDAMPLFLANYYQQRGCGNHKHKCHQSKCGKCNNHYAKRGTNRPTYYSFHINTNNNSSPRQTFKRKAELLPNEMLHFEPSYAQQSLEDTAQTAPKSVARRQANLQCTHNLLKPEGNVHAVRREAPAKHFPSEMLKFELDYTRNRLKAKEKTSLHHVAKRETKTRPLCDLAKREGNTKLVRKRDHLASKREVKSFPIEMLKFELDYKKRSIEEKRKQSTPEADMIDHDIKLYQPFNSLQPSESEDALTFEQYPVSDSSYAQQSLRNAFTRSSNGNDYIQKRDAIKLSAQPKEISASSYENTQISPEASMTDSGIKMYQPFNALQPTDLENAVAFEQNQENAVPFELNPESDISNHEQSLEPTFKRSYDENGYNQKRDAIKLSAQPKEISASSYGNTQVCPEASMTDSDIKMYQPFNALRPTESENAVAFEQNPESRISNDEQSLQTTFKRSYDENGYNQMKYAIKRYGQPVERSASSHRKTRLNPEARMIDHNIKTYQPFYALQPTISENAVTFVQNPESDSSNAQQTLQTTFKRSSNENGYSQKRDTMKMSAQPKERSASSYEDILLNPEKSMIEHDVKMYQPFYALQPTELDNTEPFQQNEEAELSNAQSLIQSSFTRSLDGQNGAKKRDTLMASAHPETSAAGSIGKRELLYQPYYALQPIESVNAETLQQNPEADSSVARVALQSSFKRNSDDRSPVEKRDTDMRYRRPVERGNRWYGKRKLSPESELVNRDIKLYQPYYALPPIESVNAETDETQEVGDSSVAQASLQSSFKRSSGDNSHARKRDTATRSARPLERGSPSAEMRESSPESELIARDIRLYQPYYALPPIESENGESLVQNPEAAVSSDAQPLLQYTMKRSFSNNSPALKRGTLRRSTSPEESSVNLYGQR